MRPESHHLFFALYPSPTTAAAIDHVAHSIKATELIRGSWVATSRFHVTLHFLGGYSVLPEELVKRAESAAASIRFAPFEFSLDNVSSFRGRWQSPCVLRGKPEHEKLLKSFWGELAAALKTCGLDEHIERRYTPHVTLAYGDKMLAKPIDVEPVVWSVSDFVLVDSLVGKTTHNKLATWLLKS